MKIKCEYCGNYIEDTEETCPNCGAPNEHLQRQAIGVPRTIEELKQWYKEHNLPPEETTRFFIGKNYTGAKAFGIYQENNGNFVVYKNKANSVRAIRYRGKDEAYAVNELYMKLKEEILNQKSHNINASTYNNQKYKKHTNIYSMILILVIIVCFFVIPLIIMISRPSRGYYYYDDTYYYYLSGSWYEYDDYSGWYRTSAPSDLKDNASDYYESTNYSYNYDVEDFSDTDFYSDWEESSSSSSSSSSWDSSDSWDSGSTDWDSDW